MANILTAQEAANVLRCETDDPAMLDLLPQVDAYIQNATGRDWAADATVHPVAKSAARMLLVRWHEDPGAMVAGQSLGFGLSACLVQLEAIALQDHTLAGRNGAGAIPLPGAEVGDTVKSVIGRVGAAGDQSAAFEEVITVSGQLQQVSAADLSANWYTVHLVPPEEM